MLLEVCRYNYWEINVWRRSSGVLEKRPLGFWYKFFGSWQASYNCLYIAPITSNDRFWVIIRWLLLCSKLICGSNKTSGITRNASSLFCKESTHQHLSVIVCYFIFVIFVDWITYSELFHTKRIHARYGRKRSLVASLQDGVNWAKI